jgi:hypothetical protein
VPGGWNVAGRSEIEIRDLKTFQTLARPKLPAEIAGGLTFSKDGLLLTMTKHLKAEPGSAAAN